MTGLETVSQIMREARERGKAEDFDRVSAELVKARNSVREAMQARTGPAVRGILAKLEGREPLSPSDIEVVRLWVVGDAEGYVKAEDDFAEWQTEFSRLAEAVGSYDGRETPGELLKLGGILTDAMRVASDILHFLEKKERVARFDAAIRELDAGGSEVIARILEACMLNECM